MNEVADALWARALEALDATRSVLGISLDAAGSRAYYAAFYAVSAHFALRGVRFTKHSAVEAAVHRDLVQAEGWPVEFARDFRRLWRLRAAGDYGDLQHVSPEAARAAVEEAAGILRTVAQRNPGVFLFPKDGPAAGGE